MANGKDSAHRLYSHAKATVWHSAFSNDLSRHTSYVKKNALYRALEVLLPTSSGQSIANEFRWETSFFYEITAPLSVLLAPRFIQEYILQGSFYMIARDAPLDQTNSAMLLPCGTLLLVVDWQTYEFLGLVGKRYENVVHRASKSAHKHTGSQYVVRIDLKSKAFATGEPNTFRDRVFELFSSRIAPFTMLLCAFSDSGVCRPVNFSEDESLERKRFEVNGELTLFKDLDLPQMHLLLTLQAPKAALKNLQQAADGVLEWSGLVACRMEELLKPMTQQDDYVSNFQPQFREVFELVSDEQLACVKWQGLLGGALIESLVAKTRDKVASGSVPFAIVLLTEIADTISVDCTKKSYQKQQQHQQSVPVGFSGKSNLLLVLPNDRYLWISSTD